MRKHRSVISILLAVMMIFTFMPAMAFAAPQVDSAGDKHEYTGISWSDDFHTAAVSVKTISSDGKTLENRTEEFAFYDEINGVPATVQDYNKGTIKYFVAKSNSGTFVNGPVTYTFYAGRAVKNEGIYATNWDYEYYWYVDEPSNYNNDLISNATGSDILRLYPENATWNDRPTLVEYGSSSPALANLRQMVAYDAYYMEVQAAPTSKWTNNKAQYEFTVDAGEYSANRAGDENSDNEAEIAGIGGWSATDDTEKEFFTVTYPEYDAYEVTEDGKDKNLTISVALNKDAITKYYGNVNVSTAKRTVGVVAKVGDPDTAWFAKWHLEGDDTANEYNVEVQNTFGTPSYGLNDGRVIYNGANHQIVFDHPAKNVTTKFYVSNKALSDSQINALKDSDWVDTVEIKNAGNYYVYVKLTTQKGKTTYSHVFKPSEVGPNNELGVVVVEKFEVPLSFTQDKLTVEYGKYTLAELEDAVAKLVTIGTSPDSADKIAEAFNKYKVFKGLFEDAGTSDIIVDVDTAKIASVDKDLAKAISNYTFWGDELTLTVQKVSNDVQINAPSTKTFKANKKTKKLAKNKSFTISATSRFGNVSFSKLSGNNKIKVSKDGKITVKKGLKKGKTYKIKVKALAQGTANYAQAYAKKTIAIKIK